MHQYNGDNVSASPKRNLLRDPNWVHGLGECCQVTNIFLSLIFLCLFVEACSSYHYIVICVCLKYYYLSNSTKSIANTKTAMLSRLHYHYHNHPLSHQCPHQHHCFDIIIILNDNNDNNQLKLIMINNRYQRHPITTRDSTLSALSDGLYVSPAIETADYHAR